MEDFTVLILRKVCHLWETLITMVIVTIDCSDVNCEDLFLDCQASLNLLKLSYAPIAQLDRARRF